MSDFDDRFSGHAATYAQRRPLYPETLFTWLASIVEHHDLAWDCGTGNGQAALPLARHFERVVATDASAEQIANAPAAANVAYHVARAEEAPIADSSVDLVTVATALHWFDLDRFYREVERVLRPGGAIVVWSYYHATISPEIDPLLRHFADVTLERWWSPRFQRVRDGYTSLPFPFTPIDVPPLAAEAEWSLDDLLGFIESWSAVQSWRKEFGDDPIALVAGDLRRTWGDDEQRRLVRWPLQVRAGRRSE